MGAGRLDRKIDIERKSVTQDEFGEEIETWGKLVSRRSASVGSVRASERFTADQFIAEQQVEFRIRHSSAVADVNPLDRIIYPASTEPDSPGLDPQIYDIIEVSELGRREFLKIIAMRRPEDHDAE